MVGIELQPAINIMQSAVASLTILTFSNLFIHIINILKSHHGSSAQNGKLTH